MDNDATDLGDQDSLASNLHDVEVANERLSTLEERFHQMESEVLRNIEYRISPGHIIRSCADYIAGAARHLEECRPHQYFLYYVPDAGSTVSVVAGSREEAVSTVREWLARKEPFVFLGNDGRGSIYLCEGDRYLLFPDGTRLLCTPEPGAGDINQSGRVGGMPLPALVTNPPDDEGGEDDDDDDD